MKSSHKRSLLKNLNKELRSLLKNKNLNKKPRGLKMRDKSNRLRILNKRVHSKSSKSLRLRKANLIQIKQLRRLG